MDHHENDVVVPVVSEEVHADAVPVQTGGVRVTKRVVPHDEVIQQELRKGRVEIKRVKVDRIVDGPQQPQRVGDTLIVPVVSETLHIEKQWVVTEEIHITQIEERENVEQRVTVNQEEAAVERLDAENNPVSAVEMPAEVQAQAPRLARESLIARKDAASTRKRVLSGPNTVIRKKPRA